MDYPTPGEISVSNQKYMGKKSIVVVLTWTM
jgi:hypothetical protein